MVCTHYSLLVVAVVAHVMSSGVAAVSFVVVAGSGLVMSSGVVVVGE